MFKRLMTFQILLILVGCSYSDENQANSETYTRLGNWGEWLKAVQDGGVNVTQYASTEEALNDWKKKRIIDRFYFERMKEDSWGRPYRWKTEESEQGTLIRISSHGRDGIDQQGEHDDLYVEIAMPRTGQARIFLKPCPRGK